jgi:hypothetical protein
MKKFLITVFSIFLFSALSAQVYINELDYDQPSTDTAEFIELIGPTGGSLDGYVVELVNGNGGAVYTTIDLNGLTIPNDNIAGYGFFVIGSANVANVDLQSFTSNGIQNGAPDGILLKLNNTVVDGFSYEGIITDNPDFTPGMAITAQETGSDSSVGRITLGFDPNNQDQYFAQGIADPSPGEQNTAHGQIFGGNTPPTISSPVRLPKIPEENQNTTVTADVTDNSDVTLVELRYTINGGSVQAVTMVNTSGDTYSGDIPESAYNDFDRVIYWVYAEDDEFASSVTPDFKFLVGERAIFDLHAADSDGALLYIGYDAKVTGVATVAIGTFQSSNLDIYIQDATGGINVFASPLNPGLTITVGNSYTVIGEVDQFNGKTEIKPEDQLNDIIDNGPVGVPDPVVKTIAQFLADAETYEGMLVAIAQVTNTGGGQPWPASGSDANIEITDDGGISLLTLRIDRDTDIDGSAEPTWPVNIRGIFNQFDFSTPLDSFYQVIPRSLDDIDIILGVNPLDGDIIATRLQLYPNYPNPFNPNTTLHFDVPSSQSNNRVSLVIYNALGQKVKTLVNDHLPAGAYEVQWNGLSENGAAAPSGIYFAELAMNGSQRQVVKMVMMK